MADIRRSVRELFLEGVKAVNSAASHVAEATRSKVDELNLRNRRHELTEKLASDAYGQWLQGTEMPDALTATLEELRSIDEKLAAHDKHSDAAEATEDSVQEETGADEEPAFSDVVPEEPEPVVYPVNEELPYQAVPTIDLDPVRHEDDDPITDQ